MPEFFNAVLLDFKCIKHSLTITNYDMLGWMLGLFRIITLSDSVTIDVISNKKLESIFV